MWAARASWVLLAVAGGGAFGDALAPHSRPVQIVGTVCLWVGWAAVTTAMVIPSVVSLTVVRSIVPGAVVLGVAAAVQASSTMAGSSVCVALAMTSLALVTSGELGRYFVQASAYGDEQRFPLRPPLSFLIPTVVSWCVLCTSAAVGPLALAAGGWWVGVPLTAASPVMGWFLGRRFHRLSRRWLVLVPAGVVVHDQLVLAETAMFPAATVAGIGLALADTEAADLTGPAPGNAIEITVRDMGTAVLAPTRDKPGGTALHVGAVLVAPTRPGAVLRAAAARALPVGPMPVR